jgi:hypothetical protein
VRHAYLITDKCPDLRPVGVLCSDVSVRGANGAPRKDRGFLIMKRKLLGCGIIAGPLFVVASQLFGQEREPAPVAASTLRGLRIQRLD